MAQPGNYSSSSQTTSCRTLKMSVDVQAVHHGPLHVTDQGKYSKEFDQACNAFKDLTANRWVKDPVTEEGARLTYFWGQERNRSTRRVLLFSVPPPPSPSDDEATNGAEPASAKSNKQAQYKEKFPFIPRRGEYITVCFGNSYDNERRVALQNDEDGKDALICRRLDDKEKLVLFAVNAESFEPCCGKVNQHGIVQLVDRCPERVCILECGATAESMGQVFLDDQSAEEVGINLRNLHVGDRVLFSAVLNLHKVKFPFRPYKMSRMRLRADTISGRTAANITIACLNTEYRRGTECVGRFSASIPKGTVLTLEVNIDTLLCEKTVQVRGYRLLPPGVVHHTNDLSTTPRPGIENNDDMPETHLNDRWPLSFMDRSCLLATRPRVEEVNRYEGASSDEMFTGIAEPVSYNGMYKWECDIGAKQTAKLQLKFVAARTGPFRANFALLTHNCEVLVPIRIDVYDSGRAPRLLIDTGCFRGQAICRSLNYDDKFNLYALRHQLHHANLIGWFDRRGEEMREPSQFTTLDCQFGTQMVLEYLLKFHQNQFKSDIGLGVDASTLFEAAEQRELFQENSRRDTDSGTGEFDDNNSNFSGDVRPGAAAAANEESDNDSTYSEERSPHHNTPYSAAPLSSVLALAKQKVTAHNFTKVYKHQLQTEAVWRSWQYMEASLRNPRMRLSSSGRILYIDMSSNRSFLSHVQRIDDKCFIFLYVIEADEQLPTAFSTTGPASRKHELLYDPEKLRQRFLYRNKRGDRGFTMVALAVNRAKNNELLCALPEGLEFPFLDYSTDPVTIRPYYDVAAEENGTQNPNFAFASRLKHSSPPNYTLFVSFKTLMVNLRRAYDALEIIQHSPLKPALARILFPSQVEPFAAECRLHATSSRTSSDSSADSATSSPTSAAETPATAETFGFRARHPHSDDKAKISAPKCTMPHVHKCPVVDCCSQRLDNTDYGADNHSADSLSSVPVVGSSSSSYQYQHPFLQPKRLHKFFFSSRDGDSAHSDRRSVCKTNSNTSNFSNASSQKDTRPSLPAKSLDVTQQSVLDNVEAGCSRPSPFVLIGPPGTGKTRTVASAILKVIESDKTARILIVASSNVAADLLYTLLTTGKQDVLVPDACDEDDLASVADDVDDEKLVFDDEPPTTALPQPYISSADSMASDSSGYSTATASSKQSIEAAKINTTHSAEKSKRSSTSNIVNGNCSLENSGSSTSVIVNQHSSRRNTVIKTAPEQHHADADIIPRDKILKPGTDIVRLFSDEHGRSTLIAADVRSDGICLKYSELKADNEDDPLLTRVAAGENASSVQKALSARVCVCTPSLAAHLHRRILDTQYVTVINGNKVTQMRYRAEPYTHLFVDEAGKCAEAELIVPMLALNLMPLIPPPPSPLQTKVPSPTKPRSVSRSGRLSRKRAARVQIPPITICTGHLKRDLAKMQPPLVMLAGDPHQLGPTHVGMRNNTDDADEEKNFFAPQCALANSTESDDQIRPPEILWTWDAVKTSLLTRLFEQYGFVQRKLAAAENSQPHPMPILMTVLRNNYRNPQIIAQFLSKHFYHGHVVSQVPPAPSHLPSVMLIKHEKLTESRDEGPSVYNIEEARVVADLAMQFIRPCENKYQFWTKFSLLRKNVAILTPYRNQANAIRIQLFRALEEQISGLLFKPENEQTTSEQGSSDWFYNKLLDRITEHCGPRDTIDLKDVVDCCLPVVATIDEYQGREADNIILSLVRSRFTVQTMNEMLLKHFQNEIGMGSQVNAESTVEEKVASLLASPAEREAACNRHLRRVLGFVAEDTRINEAITRACRRLFIVSNKKLLELCPTWCELLKHAKEVDADKLHEIVL